MRFQSLLMMFVIILAAIWVVNKFKIGGGVAALGAASMPSINQLGHMVLFGIITPLIAILAKTLIKDAFKHSPDGSFQAKLTDNA